MPIYEYQCRGCGKQFDLLVLASTAPACPSCQSSDLEQMLSGFSVSTAAISKANVRAARRKALASQDYKDKKIAEAQEIKEHSPEYLYRPPKPSGSV